MLVKPDVYTKLRAKYGDHVDQITLTSRPIRDHLGEYEYAAECREHGSVSGWTKDLDERTLRVRDHMKGIC
jgi:hypothetical protein